MTNQESAPTKSFEYKVDMEKFDDPDFNPFETKSKVANDKMEDTSPVQLEKSKKGIFKNFNPLLTTNSEEPEVETNTEKSAPNFNMSADSGKINPKIFFKIFISFFQSNFTRHLSTKILLATRITIRIWTKLLTRMTQLLEQKQNSPRLATFFSFSLFFKSFSSRTLSKMKKADQNWLRI